MLLVCVCCLSALLCIVDMIWTEIYFGSWAFCVALLL